ncbi:MAG: hypothetical protein IJW35_07390 [Lentisphaeria bacterium]|nr:hypothetical protein [Lentisphaeria bacterium]
MCRKNLWLAAVGLPLLFAGCSGEEDMNSKMAQAAIQAKQGKWEAAGKNAAIVAEAKPGEIAPKLLQALAYEKQGDFDKAMDLARQCAESAPQDFTACYTLGRIASHDPMRRSEAFSILERALELKNGDENTLILLCNLGTQIEHPRVIKYLHQLRQIKGFAQSPVLRYQFGCYYVHTKNPGQARVWLRNAARLGINSKNWDLLLACARTMDKSGFSRKDALNWYLLYRNLSRSRGVEYQEVVARINQLSRKR